MSTGKGIAAALVMALFVTGCNKGDDFSSEIAANEAALKSAEESKKQAEEARFDVTSEKLDKIPIGSTYAEVTKKLIRPGTKAREYNVDGRSGFDMHYSNTDGSVAIIGFENGKVRSKHIIYR